MRKILIAFLLVMTMGVLTGCQLAREEASAQTEGNALTDQVVGMLITSDSVAEEPAMNALHTFGSEGKRLYAELMEETYEKSDGTEGTTHHYYFPEGSGIAYMGYRVDPEDSGFEDVYWSSSIDDGIYPELHKFSTVDGVSFVELEGIIYVAETAEDLALYVNPVYQTPDGEVYALGTAPVGYQAATMDGCSVQYDQSVEETENGETTVKQEGYVKMTIEVIRLPEKYVVLEMDANNQILTKTEFTPEAMPEEYTPGTDGSYLILECYSVGEEVERTVYSPDDDSFSFESFYPLENGICVKGYTAIEWEGVQ